MEALIEYPDFVTAWQPFNMFAVATAKAFRNTKRASGSQNENWLPGLGTFRTFAANPLVTISDVFRTVTENYSSRMERFLGFSVVSGY